MSPAEFDALKVGDEIGERDALDRLRLVRVIKRTPKRVTVEGGGVYVAPYGDGHAGKRGYLTDLRRFVEMRARETLNYPRIANVTDDQLRRILAILDEVTP